MKDIPVIRSDVPLTIQATFKIDRLYSPSAKLTRAAQARNFLNQLGFKFKGDGTPFAKVDPNPVPLGKLEQWTDYSRGLITFRQTIE